MEQKSVVIVQPSSNPHEVMNIVMSWRNVLTNLQSRYRSDHLMLLWQQRLQSYMPIVDWLPRYIVKRDLKYDLVAGITVAMMLIPQEVSLSTIMHVPANHGLYTAATSPLVYAIFGSSTVLSVSSGSEVSLLVGSTLEQIQNQDERVATGIFMAFLSGSMLLLVRILNLSQIADFFSRPVMGGFVSAGGLLIMLSQVPNALGIKIKSTEYPPMKVYQVFESINETNINALAITTVSCIYLITIKMIKSYFFPSLVMMRLFQKDTSVTRKQSKVEEEEEERPGTNLDHGVSLTNHQYSTYEAQQTPQEEDESVTDAGKHQLNVKQSNAKKTLPIAVFLLRMICNLGPLVVCIFGGLVGYTLGPSHLNLTGDILGGFPKPKVPWYGFTSHIINTDRFGTIFYHAATVSVVVFLSSIAMAKRIAIQRGEDINTEQELTGIGIASIVCGFLQAMPPTGGMSRTAVNLQNAHTQLASIITCLIVVLALYTLTGTLYYLPSASLASIIIVAGWALVEFREAKWLYRVKRDEFFVWVASFASTLCLGVLNGLIASILCSVLALMWKSKVQPVVVLGELDTGSYVDRESFPEASHLGNIIAIRVESSLYFANCERVAQLIDLEMVRLQVLGITTRGVVLDAFHINDMDATTIQVLSDTQEKLAVRKVRFAIANAKSRVYDMLATTNLLERLLANDPTISLMLAVRMLRELPSLADKSTSVV